MEGQGSSGGHELGEVLRRVFDLKVLLRVGPGIKDPDVVFLVGPINGQVSRVIGVGGRDLSNVIFHGWNVCLFAMDGQLAVDGEVLISESSDNGDG